MNGRPGGLARRIGHNVGLVNRRQSVGMLARPAGHPFASGLAREPPRQENPQQRDQHQ